MSLFNFGTNTNPPATPTTPAPTPAAPTGTPAPTPAPTTPPATETPPAGGQPLFPAAPSTETPPTPAGPIDVSTQTGPIDLGALLGRPAAPATPEAATQAFAAQAIEGMLSDVDRTSSLGAGNAPRINEESVAAQLPDINFLDGFDMTAFETALDSTDNRTEMLAKFGNMIGANVIKLMLPLVNAYGSSLREASIQGALTQGSEQQGIQSVVTAFQNTHAYGNNPALSGMLPGLVAQVEKMVQPNTPVDLKVAAVHSLLQSLAPSMPAEAPQGGPAQSGTDFTGMFNPKT